MSGATTRITNTLFTAAVPSAPPEAHQSSGGGGGKKAVETPAALLCAGAEQRTRRRIVLIKAGERGYYVTGFDGQAMELAEARILVDRLNVGRGRDRGPASGHGRRLGLGFHVPAADPDHPLNGGTLRTVDASMANAEQGGAMNAQTRGPAMPEGMEAISKEQFFAMLSADPRDIMPSNRAPDYTSG
ncbi:hypothetical protein QTI33_08820 [Variovorax sp. J22P271]|uniref:hypothetical protein n=1 Tax=Variovorax davisae TaxID=3053515 RepID=UPI002575C27F|nr:hypothetical protein [Variovorax sp. J22P271]MDM0032232.1 hypothetical protein [Variovorax sp. J22P271]